MSGSALGTCMLEAEARSYRVTSSGTPKGPEDLHQKWHVLSCGWRQQAIASLRCLPIRAWLPPEEGPSAPREGYAHLCSLTWRLLCLPQHRFVQI